MSKKTKVVRKKDTGIIHVPDSGVYAFQIGAATSSSWTDQLSSNSVSTASWESDPELVQGKEIVPYGSNNNLPVEIRQIMDDNNLAPGILEREKGLLFGQGPQLYKDYWKEGSYQREWLHDKKVWDWLNSWDLLKYLEQAINEYKYLKAHFTKYYNNKGIRIGRQGKITKLECVSATDARLAWVKSRRLEDVKKIYIGDFENNCERGIRTYPVFDPYNPFDQKVSIYYHNSASFARNFYPVPGYYGALNWIKRSSDIPEILKYLTDNSLNIGYIVHSPAQYWEEKKAALEEKYNDKEERYIDKKLETLKDETFEKLGQVMSGKKNVGKFFETVDFYDDEGNKCSWSIEPVDNKAKDFIESQIKIAEKADSATTSGIGLHPALSNIMVDGKLSSGSEMLYALKLYLNSDTAIPEAIVMQGINYALKANFPGKDLKLGFYRNIVMKESDVSPDKRVKENT